MVDNNLPDDLAQILDMVVPNLASDCMIVGNGDSDSKSNLKVEGNVQGF